MGMEATHMTEERKALIDKMLRTDVSNQFDREYVSPERKREIAVCQAPIRGERRAR